MKKIKLVLFLILPVIFILILILSNILDNKITGNVGEENNKQIKTQRSVKSEDMGNETESEIKIKETKEPELMSELFNGTATYYNGGYESGTCMLAGSIYEDEYVCALNSYDYDKAKLAGACLEIEGPDGIVKAIVTDLYPGGERGDLDLNKDAFSKVADLSKGIVDITWRIVEREVEGPLVIKFKNGSTKNWIALQIRNHKTPIDKLEILTSDGEYKSIEREEYNYFQFDNPGEGPFTFRITDIFGVSIVEKNVPLKVGEVGCKNQF